MAIGHSSIHRSGRRETRKGHVEETTSEEGGKLNKCVMFQKPKEESIKKEKVFSYIKSC